MCEPGHLLQHIRHIFDPIVFNVIFFFGGGGSFGAVVSKELSNSKTDESRARLKFKTFSHYSTYVKLVTNSLVILFLTFGMRGIRTLTGFTLESSHCYTAQKADMPYNRRGT